MSAFSERLKELRKAKGLTQSEISEKLNVHLQTVSKWERGVFEPDVSLLGELSSLYGVSLEKLCGVEEGEELYAGTFDLVSFGETIAERRKDIAKSQKALADELGVPSDAVSKWERGVTCPDLPTFIRLAEVLALPLSGLYYGIKKETPIEQVSYNRKIKKPILFFSICASLLVCIAVILAIFLPKAIVKKYTVVIDGDKKYTVSANDWFIPNSTEKSGYDLVGYVNAQGEEVVFPIKISGDSSFNAVYKVHEYDINYWSNGGTLIEPITSFTIESGEIELVTPTKQNAVFEGWYLFPDFSGESLEKLNFADRDINVYAKWSDGECSVQYVLNGGACEGNPTTITPSQSVVLFEPVKKGYIFLGWYDSASGGTRYESVGGANTKNLTLYALWQKSEENYVITYELSGGVLANENPVSMQVGEAFELYSPSKDGYSFVGWNDSPDGSGNYFTTLKNLTSSLNLFAIYSPKTYVVRYEYGGTYESEPNPNSISFGERVTLNPVKKHGYDFVGWYTDAENGDKVTEINEDNLLSIQVLYARFTPVVYAVELNAVDGEIVFVGCNKKTATLEIPFGETVTLPQCELEGFAFVGWYVGDKLYEKINELNVGNLSLVAVYSNVSGYPVQYVLDGGTPLGENPERAYFGSSVALLGAEKTGYIFLGWNDSADGNGNYYTATPSDISQSLTLYAIWQVIVVNGSSENFVYEKTLDQVTITKYEGAYGNNVDIVIPAFIDGLPVTKIGNGNNNIFGLYSNYGSYTQNSGGEVVSSNMYCHSLVIPEGVLEIASGAFFYLQTTETLVIPSSVKTIGDHAFFRISNVYINDDSELETLGEYAFTFAKYNGVLKIPSGVKRIEKSAFAQVTLDGLDVGNVTYFADKAFYFTKLFSLYLPKTVKYVGSEAFYGEGDVGLQRYSIYAGFDKSATNLFASNWCSGSVLNVVFGVTEKKITLVNGEDSEVYTGNKLLLPKLYKSGYNFLGWKQGDVFVPYMFNTAVDATLEAVFEEDTLSDGRSATSCRTLGVDGSEKISLIGGENFYFKIDSAKTCMVSIVIPDRYSSYKKSIVLSLDGKALFSTSGVVETAGDKIYSLCLNTKVLCSCMEIEILIVEID